MFAFMRTLIIIIMFTSNAYVYGYVYAYVCVYVYVMFAVMFTVFLVLWIASRLHWWFRKEIRRPRHVSTT